MGKKGSWFSAIKRAFTHNSKEKSSYGSDKRSSKEKKASKGTIRQGEPKSLIPRFREPSSIEKILGEADELIFRPPAYAEATKPSPASLWRPPSPRAWAASPKAPSPRAVSPKAVPPSTSSPYAASSSPYAASLDYVPLELPQNRWGNRYVQRPELAPRNQHASATMIQAAFRGYLARRSFRALRGLVRLQGMVRSQNAKRQTANAMKQMQLLVRVQTQIQSRRIQMLENQAYKVDKEVDNTFSKWTLNQPPDARNNGDWDDSLLTKEEEEERLQKKVEAVVKRERAMAYAYSHQLWKASPKTTQPPPDTRSTGFPWWWNWLERQLPQPQATTPLNQTAIKTVASTPPRPVPEYIPSPQLNAASIYKQSHFPPNDNHEVVRAKPVTSTMLFNSNTSMSKTPPPAGLIKSSKPRGKTAAYDYPLKDDDSLTSCPPMSVPSYMAPTVSAKAKARATSNPKERLGGTPVNESKRRFSFSLTTNIGSFKWNKGPSKEPPAQKGFEKHISGRSFGDLSIDSTVSMPAVVGRRPFNRFV